MRRRRRSRKRGIQVLVKRLFYFIIFVAVFILVCYLLVSPRIGKLFFPFPYREHVQASAERYSLDPLFVAALIQTESGFRPHVVSPRGARGLMQVMPSTAEWVAQNMGIDYSPDMLFEPQYNIEIGCWYMADLLKLFNGETAIALAAYNGGRGEVRRWLDEGVWDGQESELEQIPFTETRNFVRQVMESYRHYQQIY